MDEREMIPRRGGPLQGLKVVELGGIGPGPFATMTLADMGADVVRIDRPGEVGQFPGTPRQDLLNRGKRSIALDLKSSTDLATALQLIDQADVVVEGFRPGVAERLGLGPEICIERNPRLVYGRMTGWGQTGPLAHEVGHDIGYVSVTGALHAIGDRGGAPVVPLNLVGDFGGGGMYLVAGVLAALHHVSAGGAGQVVDAAIVDGAAHLLTGTHAMLASGTWVDERGQNVLDGAAPFYGVYETRDHEYMSVGAVEPQFYASLLTALGVGDDPRHQYDRTRWTELRDRFAQVFSTRTRAEWVDIFEGTDACVAPVVSLLDAAKHSHLEARQTLVEHGGYLQAAPAPRFSTTRTSLGVLPPFPGEHSSEIRDELCRVPQERSAERLDITGPAPSGPAAR